MTPFQQFRLWLTRAPAAERIGTGMVGLLVLGLLAWALVPSGAPAGSSLLTGAPQPATSTPAPAPPAGTTPTTTAAAATPAPASQAAETAPAPLGSPTGPAPGVAAPAARAGSARVASGQGRRAAASSGGATRPVSASPACGPHGSTDQGVTSTQIRVGVVLLDLAGQAGNTLVGYPTPQQQQGDYQAVIDAANKAGGVQCRTLVPVFYQANPLSTSEEQATCLQMAQDQLFAAISVGFDGPPYEDCPAQNKIPTILELPLAPSEIHQFYPYLFTAAAQWEQLMSNYVLALHEMGWLQAAGKIGVLEEDCNPSLNTYLLSHLASVGVRSSSLTTFDYGCPGSLVPPNEIEEAVLEFKTAGVTNVMDADTVSENDFSKEAQIQDYHPKYSGPDGGMVASFDSAEFAPDATNFNGAIAITAAQWGAPQTPGVPVTPATQGCDSVLARAGLPSAETSPDGAGGMACDLVDMLVAAADHDVPLTRLGLATGLDRVGNFAFSYPQGPADFSGAGVMNGGQFWRADVYDGSCPCFKVLKAAFQPSFT